MGNATRVPDLADDQAALPVNLLGDAAPAGALVPRIDAGRTLVADGGRCDVGGL
jgi:hypothetical protein